MKREDFCLTTTYLNYEAGGFGLVMETGSDSVRANNPKFAKLVDVISSTHREDGVSNSVRSQLKLVGMGQKPATSTCSF